MRYLIALCLCLFVSGVYANPIPTVAEIEQLIASRDYGKAKEQLRVVLKEQPDSIVARQYMLEIVKIENARDNISTPEYKFAENELNAAKDRLAAIKKAKADAIAKEEERLAQIQRNIFLAKFFKVMLSVILLLAIVAFSTTIYRKIQNSIEDRKVRLQQLAEEREWVDRMRVKVMDIIDDIESINIDSLESEKQILAHARTKEELLLILSNLDDDNYEREHVENYIEYTTPRLITAILTGEGFA